MSYTRRSVLGLTSLSLAGLSGCIGNLLPGSDSGGSQTPASSSGGTPQPSTPTPTPTETATATPTPTPAIAERTGKIFAQIRWFATEYERAMRRYRLHASRVKEQVTNMSKTGTVTQDDISILREHTDTFGSYVTSELAPHFVLNDTLKRGGLAYVQQLERAVRVGDEGEQRRVLGILSGYYDSITSQTYISKHLSREPIREPLQELLLTSGKAIVGISYPGTGMLTFTYSNDYKMDDDGWIPAHYHEWDSGHRMYAHSHDHGQDHDIRDHQNEPDSGRVYAFKDGAVDLLKDTELWRDEMSDYEREFTDVFGPVSRGEDRDDRVYLLVNDVSKEFTAYPLYLQQYADTAAAEAAFDSLYESNVTKIGTKTLAGRTWTKSFYNTSGGPSIYLDVAQFGRFVVAAAPSPKPYGRRDEWPDQMQRSWLAMEEPASDGDSK